MVIYLVEEITAELPLIFPVHPRTRANIARFGIDLGPDLVLTDSGGLQEKTTAPGVPCVTPRENTGRPVTVEEGSNVVAA